MSAQPATLFFDMDGTLIDSEPGIVGGIVHTFDKLGQMLPSMDQLRGWIGPPLRDSFHERFAGDEGLVEQALVLYRERYDRVGWTEHSVFPGIAEVIPALRAAGHRMAVVTSKNERFARRIVDHLPFGDCFEEVVGASDDGSRRSKPDMVAEALRRLHALPAQCVMIGDRRMDIEGARAHGLRSIGVLWGFGDEAELTRAGADQLARSPDELLQRL
ncbi:MAG TPA: HAD family hydrolase [Stenotrophomonas sp.]|nr:HAD family hydrolase [Stenotrophomonas sp.]